MGQAAPLIAGQPSLPISALIHHQEDPIISIEKQLISTLDALERTGVLQCSNWLDISKLLNPPDEAFAVNMATDKDIFEAVMEAKWVQEDKSNDSDPVEPDSTHAELLQAGC